MEVSPGERMRDPKLLIELEELGAALDTGTESYARARRTTHETALENLVRRSLAASPVIVEAHYRKRGFLDGLVVLTVIALVVLGLRTAYVLTSQEPVPERNALRVRLSEGEAGAPVDESHLAGRALLTLPIEPASYALLGDLPTRVSAAVVPDSIPEDGPARPLAFFDDLLVLEAEATEGEVAVLVAVAPEEVQALLAALPGATVHLLRRPVGAPSDSEPAERAPTT